MNYPVPGLARGIKVLQMLDNYSGITLEQLSKLIKIPKASLLRILKTLVQLNLVQRCGFDKTYSVTSILIERQGPEEKLRQKISRNLQRISRKTGQTAEWYIPNKKGMILIEQVVPEDKEVAVKAKIGFIRSLSSELEAVSCLALALKTDKDLPEKMWSYTKDGKEQQISKRQLKYLLQQAQEKQCHVDCFYNSNGVRRIARAVFDKDRLLGIVALAMSYQPDNAKKIPAWLKELKI